MRTLVIGLFCLLVLGTSAEARQHHYARVSHAQALQNAGGCIPTGDNMRPCAYNPNFLAGVRSIQVNMKRVSTRLARHHRTLVAYAPAYRSQDEAPQRVYRSPERVDYASRQGEVIGGRPSGCPHAYCGCSVSLKVFGKIVPSLNLASNWGRFQSTSPAAGMVAYRSHHVFYIMSVNSDGTVVAHDGNSGRGLTRIHTVSLRGYHVVNPHS